MDPVLATSRETQTSRVRNVRASVAISDELDRTPSPKKANGSPTCASSHKKSRYLIDALRSLRPRSKSRVLDENVAARTVGRRWSAWDIFASIRTQRPVNSDDSKFALTDSRPQTTSPSKRNVVIDEELYVEPKRRKSLGDIIGTITNKISSKCNTISLCNQAQAELSAGLTSSLERHDNPHQTRQIDCFENILPVLPSETHRLVQPPKLQEEDGSSDIFADPEPNELQPLYVPRQQPTVPAPGMNVLSDMRDLDPDFLKRSAGRREKYQRLSSGSAIFDTSESESTAQSIEFCMAKIPKNPELSSANEDKPEASQDVRSLEAKADSNFARDDQKGWDIIAFGTNVFSERKWKSHNSLRRSHSLNGKLQNDRSTDQTLDRLVETRTTSKVITISRFPTSNNTIDLTSNSVANGKPHRVRDERYCASYSIKAFPNHETGAQGTTKKDTLKVRPSSQKNRQLSLAPVHVEFPATENRAAYSQTYESTTDAISGLYDQSQGQYSNFCMYDRPNRTIYAYPRQEILPGVLDMRRRQGLEVIWLPMDDLATGRTVLDARMADPLLRSNLPEEHKLSGSASRKTSGEMVLINPLDPSSLERIPTLLSINSEGLQTPSYSDGDSCDGHTNSFSRKAEQSPYSSAGEGSNPRSEAGSASLEHAYEIDFDAKITRSIVSFQFTQSTDSQTSSIECQEKHEEDVIRPDSVNKIWCELDDTALVAGETAKTWFDLGRAFIQEHPASSSAKPERAYRTSAENTRVGQESNVAEIQDRDAGTGESTYPDACGALFQDLHDALSTKSRDSSTDFLLRFSSVSPSTQHIEDFETPEMTTERSYGLDGQGGLLDREVIRLSNSSIMDLDFAGTNVLKAGTCSTFRFTKSSEESHRLSVPQSPPLQNSNGEAERDYFSREFQCQTASSIEDNVDCGNGSINGDSQMMGANEDTRPGSPISLATGLKFSVYDDEYHKTDRESEGINSFRDLKASLTIGNRSEAVKSSEVPKSPLKAITDEDLNIRVVGKAACNSALARQENKAVGALIDIFQARGLMPQSLRPALHRTPRLLSRTSPPRTVLGPLGGVYPENGSSSDISSPTNRATTPHSPLLRPHSRLSDADTDKSSTFGYNLEKVESYHKEAMNMHGQDFMLYG